MKLNLSQPYPLNESTEERLTTSIAFASFVFLFLFVFQPFGLSGLPNGIFVIALGYGTICFVIMMILNLVAFQLLPAYFSENTWTSKRQVLWIITNVIFIGVGNYIFSAVIELTAFTWWNLFLFETYTISVAVFPVTISVLTNQIRLRTKFERHSIVLNENIEKRQGNSHLKSEASVVRLFEGNEEFELIIADFLFAKSDDNYVEIYFLSEGAVSRKIFRNTLKKVYSSLSDSKTILHCHRSYIVNLQHVQRVTGNAQGYRLQLKGTKEVLPVSRKLIKTIGSYLASSS